jgi:hypothetical protein
MNLKAILFSTLIFCVAGNTIKDDVEVFETSTPKLLDIDSITIDVGFKTDIEHVDESTTTTTKQPEIEIGNSNDLDIRGGSEDKKVGTEDDNVKIDVEGVFKEFDDALKKLDLEFQKIMKNLEQVQFGFTQQMDKFEENFKVEIKNIDNDFARMGKVFEDSFLKVDEITKSSEESKEDSKETKV